MLHSDDNISYLLSIYSTLAVMDIRIKPLFFLETLLLFFVSFETELSIGTDTFFPSQSISGNQRLTSRGGRFELGFFQPSKFQNYYIGIWYKNLPIRTVVWVANRDIPLPDPFSSKLELTENGSLFLLNQSNHHVWSTGSFSNTLNSTVMVLEDNGNLVLRNSSNSSILLWQSFDHPTDTWLPGAKLGLNKLTHQRQVYFSWKDPNDPAEGPFSLELDQNGTKQYFIMWNGYKHWTCGIWPGRVSVFGPDMLASNYHNMTYVSNEKENYFTYSVTNSSVLVRFVMDSSGQLRQLTWRGDEQKWELSWARPKQQCEIYAYCGEYGGCNQFSAPTCKCLQGFEPRKPQEWLARNHSHGCVRRTPLQCSRGGKDGFLMIPNIRLPAYAVSLTVGSSKECKLACLNNCSCTAYTYDGECSIWQEDLLNIQYLSFGDSLGRDLHLRLAMPELRSIGSKAKGKIQGAIAGGAAGFVALGVILGLILIIWRSRRMRFSGALKATENSLSLFTYSDLRSATKNFSEKLGEGGFGSVFKGSLPNSVSIAVKKLKSCSQGEKQFRAEVSTIATIHHLNLVRLRGFCADGMERFLVYDYMPNGSLEGHLFGKLSKVLDWKTRYQIALGIARGLAYLHENCIDCIIHCDIKPENILLDASFNPKVSDFGMAKLLGRDFSRVLTTIKGTRGYLAPEWISGIPITPKADVFSYGMMLFEIISGRRNWEMTCDEADDYFPSQVLKILSRGDEVLSLFNYKLDRNANTEELTRACRVACWCIQDDEKDRPSMGRVVHILEGLLEVNTPPVPRFLQHIGVYRTEEKIGDSFSAATLPAENKDV